MNDNNKSRIIFCMLSAIWKSILKIVKTIILISVLCIFVALIPRFYNYLWLFRVLIIIMLIFMIFVGIKLLVNLFRVCKNDQIRD